MKLMHLSDLHLGKQVYGFSMIEDQRYILDQILEIAEQEQPDAVLIAGDIYDRPIPPAEAVNLLDDFLVHLSAGKQQVFLLCGNHDSPERLAFGEKLISRSGIHISPVYNGTIRPVTLEDAFGAVHIYMLPFVKPSIVRRFFPDAEIASYTDAVMQAINAMQVDPGRRNVLVTHQFVTGAQRSQSEEISVGGADNVDAEVFEAFDYVALGHIHKPQNIDHGRIRYSGSILKYSFSEARDEKSVTIAELDNKGSLSLRCVPLKPLHDMTELRGTYDELMARNFYENQEFREHYLHITLEDEEDVLNAVFNLSVIYPRLMKLDYDNVRTRHEARLDHAEYAAFRSPEELFAEFYEDRNGTSLSEEQSVLIRNMIAKIWEDAE